MEGSGDIGEGQDTHFNKVLKPIEVTNAQDRINNGVSASSPDSLLRTDPVASVKTDSGPGNAWDRLRNAVREIKNHGNKEQPSLIQQVSTIDQAPGHIDEVAAQREKRAMAEAPTQALPPKVEQIS